jgi:hypothetical protein
LVVHGPRHAPSTRRPAPTPALCCCFFSNKAKKNNYNQENKTHNTQAHKNKKQGTVTPCSVQPEPAPTSPDFFFFMLI